MCVQSETGLNEFDAVSSSLGVFYNSTKKFSELKTTTATEIGGNVNNGGLPAKLAVLISASSDVHVYGVKSDKGTSDGFMSLPLTEESVEFFVAVWK